MKIYLITPIYPSITAPKGKTAVIHYFTREWVRQGHDIHVFHLDARWPTLYYYIARILHRTISSLVGFVVPSKPPVEYEETYEGVCISHLNIKKVLPHSLPSKHELNIAKAKILSYCHQNGYPDCFVGHWDNPQIEILSELKRETGIPTTIVLHNNTFNLEKTHGINTREMLRSFDLIGFRSVIAKKNYTIKYGNPNHSFLAYSGVSEIFLKQYPNKNNRIPLKFVFVGSLIKRKFPKEILLALNKAYPKGSFELTYIGDGAEQDSIKQCQTCGAVKFTGRIKREEIIKYLLEADCFIMISKDEIFGLVYLEAMACGCIPIGSRNEGIDGIIEDGKNGYLCEAGNVYELINILNKLRTISPEERNNLINNAIKTAHQYSDVNVASSYIKSLRQITSFK